MAVVWGITIRNFSKAGTKGKMKQLEVHISALIDKMTNHTRHLQGTDTSLDHFI